MDRAASPKPDLTAPGLKWTLRKGGWEARWRPRADLVRRGYPATSVPLWIGWQLGPMEDQYIRHQCDRLQNEMLVWGRGGIPQLASFDGTVKSLVECYQTDPDSRYRHLRFQTRRNYDSLCARLIRDAGSETIANIKARLLRRWHEQWAAGGKVAMSHSLIGMLRTLMTFGATYLESDDCAKVSGLLSAMRFQMTKPRGERITAAQAAAVRAKAHEMGLHSIALAQAIQFDCTLRQKDVIGEWIPQGEPGLSDVTAGNEKWMAGLRWSEIDDNLILRHVTSKRQKAVEIDLKLAPMVMEELARYKNVPKCTDPVIVFERSGRPYESYQFREQWRKVATAAGVPKHVFNMDSRAGAISEAFLAGASPDHVRQAATHSNISTTMGYDRAQAEATAEVMRVRIEHRNKR